MWGAAVIVLSVVIIVSLGITIYAQNLQMQEIRQFQTMLADFKTAHASNLNVELLIINGTNWYFGKDGFTVISQSTNATAVIEQMMNYAVEGN